MAATCSTPRPGISRLIRISGMVALVSAAMALSSCGDSSGVAFCSGNSGFQATIGESVTFTWSSCALGSLAVLDPNGRVMWAIQGRFESPVSYGIVPPGADVVEVMRNLQVGTTYRAFAGVGQNSIGIAEFTR
jgi:hypothetical protein